MTSTGFRTFPSVHTDSQQTTDPVDEQQIEENYEVTVSTYDESGVKILSSDPMMDPFTTGEGYLFSYIYIYVFDKILTYILFN